MLIQTCSYCAYWDGDPDGASGQCRFNAPVIGPMGAAWPKTGVDDGCGRHELVDTDDKGERADRESA